MTLIYYLLIEEFQAVKVETFPGRWRLTTENHTSLKPVEFDFFHREISNLELK